MKQPVVLTIAGSDSSGGAGIQADIKTITVLGGYAESVITAITAQNTCGIRKMKGVSSKMLSAQLQAVLEDIPPKIIKIGMLYGSEQILCIMDYLREYPNIPVILDPILASTSGTNLLEGKELQYMVQYLFPYVTLLTPNLPELERLSHMPCENLEQQTAAAKALKRKYGFSVLAKGGHGSCTDVLIKREDTIFYPQEKIDNKDTHGTGCTLSSAIATYMAKGYSMIDSVQKAKEYITGAIQYGLHLGHGHGPLAHNYRIEVDE